MSLLLMGTKVGMTRVFRTGGRNLPVTVLEVGPCVVTQVKTVERDGYAAVQIGFGEIQARNSTIPIIGHDARAKTGPKRFHREFRVADDAAAAEFELGQELGVDRFASMAFVDVVATSKGKGFQGTMKRHNFAGLEASHGVERKHRSPGSIGGHGTNLGTGPKIKKGKKMAGQMGNVRTTVRSLEVVSIDAERGLLLLKGGVPGPNGGMVMIKEPTRLYAPKARKQKEAASAA